MKITISNADYVVIRSGYTSRILKKSKDDFEYWDPVEDEEGDMETKGEDSEDVKEAMTAFLRNRGCLYIHDSLWGTGFYPIGENTEEIEKVRELLEKDSPKMTGYIVFKIGSLSDAFSIASQLMKLNYCACFCHENLYDIQYLTDDCATKMVILTYDTESG